MTTIDIFNPQISTVTKDLRGKAILIYGYNDTGKTLQSTRAKKPFYLGFEHGIRSIPGVRYETINDWATFKKINMQLTGKNTVEKAREVYETIIFDGVGASATMCQNFICKKNNAEHIGEVAAPGENRPNLWTAYEKEYFDEITKLLKSGFTVIFLGHEELNKETGQMIPKGDKRSMKLIQDNADITAYLKSNGVDEKGKVIMSSAYFAQTPEFFARSRYIYMDRYLEEFTIEGLERLVAEAVKKEEEISGIKSVSFEEQQKQMKTEDLDYDKLQLEMSKIGSELVSAGYAEELVEVVEKYLGRGAKVSEISKTKVDILSLILLEVKALSEVLLNK